MAVVLDLQPGAKVGEARIVTGFDHVASISLPLGRQTPDGGFGFSFAHHVALMP